MKAFTSFKATVIALFAVEAACLDTASKCCNALAKNRHLKGKVFYPDTSVYEERLESIWSLSAQQAPWCVVLPGSVEDVSTIMKVVSKKECPFGIRGGGHGFFALANSVEEGITIDFGHMNTTSYDQEKGVVALGPGCRSANVYEALEDDGVAVTGGRIGAVGLSGFVMGGGNSFHSGSDGWGCDNVINFEVVLADGSIISANENEHRDLWVALRGSSGNFGLITRFDMKAIPYADRNLPNIYGGLVTFDLEKRDEFIDAYLRFVDDTPTDQYSSVGWWQDYYSDTDETVLLAAIDNSANKQDTPQINKLLDIGGIKSNSLRSDSLANITRELDGEENLYNIWFTSTFDSDARIINYALKRNEQLVQEVLAAKAPGTNIRSRAMFQPITKTMVSHSKGNNVLGLESRVARGNGVLFLVRILIDNAEDEAIAIPLVQKLNEDITNYATELGINWDWQYLNYAHGLQDPIATYGADNLEKLRKASQKYDPKGIFQNVRGSGFKIPF